MNYIDFDNICRSCAYDRDLQPIEDNFVTDLFQKLIDVNYRKTDELPQKICETCIQTIYNIQEFVLKCKKINLRFKKHVSNLKNKSISDETINSETLSCSANNNNIKTTEFITNIVSNAETTIDQTNDSQHETEPLINAPLNDSKEIVNFAFNDEFLISYNELNVESQIVTTAIANESSMEISECIELNTEPEEDTFMETRNDLMDTTTENNRTINTGDKKKIVDLKKVLLDLENEFSFDTKSDFLNKELNLVSLEENESIAGDMEQTEIFIPGANLLKFEDDIVIVDVISPKC